METKEAAVPAEATEAAPDRAATVLAVVGQLAHELQPGRRWPELTLDSSLEREAGLDSLARSELLVRLERELGVRLPASVLVAAESPRDLLQALSASGPRRTTAEPAAPTAAEALAAPAPAQTRTLVEVLAWHTAKHPERRHVAFFDGDGPAQELTYGELSRRATAVAAGLLREGLPPQQAVGLMLPSGLDYFVAFYGVLLSGGIPVPLYPPARRSQIADHLRRQAGILETARAGILITFPEVLGLARLLSAQLPGLELTTVAALATPEGGESGEATPLPQVAASDVAFLQFTSGSTGDPKGVVLTHANLLANLRAIGRGAEIAPDDVVVSWLPLYHDMGLIGSWMASLYYGLPLVLMSPLTFLARPALWLQAISRHRGTLSAAPNFAYELCAQKIDDSELEGVDLSSWRFALNGAEPVSPDAIRRFSERFGRHGFAARAMAPVYGLAECSLALAFPPLGRGPVVDRVQRTPFERSGQATAASADDPETLQFVACGFPLAGHELRIVDSAGRELPERRQGRLLFRGPSATAGYYRNPEATRRLIVGADGDWLDSGDLAYLAAGELYVTGRSKDLIIKAGRNLYPQELERAVGEVPGVRTGCVAVFGSPDPATGTERLVVVAETREVGREARDALRQRIEAAALDAVGVAADEVVLVPPQGVPKTS
ncbi:MAG TPA: AMP-binding protein, partial [Thermoanaerobaculia bacterium]